MFVEVYKKRFQMRNLPKSRLEKFQLTRYCSFRIGLFLFVLLNLTFAEVIAQGGYRITGRFGSGFRFQSTDVWNIEMQYAGNKTVNAYIEATITDVKGRKLIQLTTDAFVLQPGSNSLSSITTTTKTQQYFVQGLPDLEQVYGSLPAGTYIICYQAFCATLDCDGNGAGMLYNEFPECIQILVEPPASLLLSWPEDGAEIEIRRPGFNWIPPMPLAQVPGFNYTHSLYQASKGQTCNEAALMNQPIYRIGGIEQLSLPYPPELDDLDTGKTYCWKVDGFISDIQVAQSEVWRLKVKPVLPEKRNKVVIVPLLVPSTEAYTVSAEDTLIVIFQEDYQKTDTKWIVKLTIDGEAETDDISEMVITPRFTGSGNIYLLPAELIGIKTKRNYMLSIINAKQDVFKTRIIFQ